MLHSNAKGMFIIIVIKIITLPMTFVSLQISYLILTFCVYVY